MYAIIELQTNDGQTVNTPIQYQDTRDKAMSVYHGILQYAAVSEVEYHTVMVVDEQGQYIARECYEHPKEERFIAEVENVIDKADAE